MANREQYWREVFRGWESSGETQKEYCLRVGVSLTQFRWWRSELKRRNNRLVESGRAMETGFVRVHVQDPSRPKANAGMVEVVLKSGIRIAFRDEDGVPGSLSSLVAVLESVGC